MNSIPDCEPKTGVLTVTFLRPVEEDRLDELAATLHQALLTEGVGRFLWHQQGRQHNELVFHIFGERAPWIARAELDRLGYDRRAFVVTDFSVQPVYETSTVTR